MADYADKNVSLERLKIIKEKAIECTNEKNRRDAVKEFPPKSKFKWLDFDVIFSNEKILYSQGKYVDLVEASLKTFESIDEKRRLMNLLDLKLISLLESIELHNEPYRNEIDEDIRNPNICWSGDTVYARLQLNKGISNSLGLPSINERLLNLISHYS